MGELAIQCLLGQSAIKANGFQCRYCKGRYPTLRNFGDHLARCHKSSIEELFKSTFSSLGKVESENEEPTMSMKLVEAINGTKDQIEMEQCDRCKYFASRRNL